MDAPVRPRYPSNLLPLRRHRKVVCRPYLQKPQAARRGEQRQQWTPLFSLKVAQQPLEAPKSPLQRLQRTIQPQLFVHHLHGDLAPPFARFISLLYAFKARSKPFGVLMDSNGRPVQGRPTGAVENGRARALEARMSITLALCGPQTLLLGQLVLAGQPPGNSAVVAPQQLPYRFPAIALAMELLHESMFLVANVFVVRRHGALDHEGCERHKP